MSLRILIVKQEGHAREGLRSTLSSEGHAVTVAGDIWEGFALVALEPFDLLLLDDDVRPDRDEAMIVVDLLSFARRTHPGTWRDRHLELRGERGALPARARSAGRAREARGDQPIALGAGGLDVAPALTLPPPAGRLRCDFHATEEVDDLLAGNSRPLEHARGRARLRVGRDGDRSALRPADPDRRHARPHRAARRDRAPAQDHRRDLRRGAEPG